jgi:hypothetical protein
LKNLFEYLRLEFAHFLQILLNTASFFDTD